MKNIFSIMSRKTKLKCGGIIILAFVGSLLASIWPVKLGDLYTNISNGSINSLSKASFTVLTFGVIYLLSECITILRRVLLDCIVATHEAEVREDSVEKLLKMPVSFNSDGISGEKTAQLNQGVAGFSQLIKIMCNDVFATLLTAACTLIQVFLNAHGIMVGIMLLYLISTVIISSFQIRSQNGIRESIVCQKNALDGQICQAIDNFELIRQMNAEEYEKKRLTPSIRTVRDTEKRHHRYMGSFDCVKQLCKILFQIVIISVSILLIANGQMPAGSVITVCLLFQQLVKPIDDVYRFMDETASSIIKAKSLFEVVNSPHDAVFDIVSSEDGKSDDCIRIYGLAVANPKMDTILALYDDITIHGNKRTALQGPNGCGKSSLVKSLTRYYPHTSGHIQLFGKDQDSYDQAELMETIYYTPQKSFFIAGTVRDNLIYGIDREISDVELITVLRRVHLTGSDHSDTVINTDPQKALNTLIGGNVEQLSGGMQQRLSLARAFLRSPKLYIFDEITANLDEKATEFVLSSIENHAKEVGAGILYISHEKAVVDRCDEVITLKNQLRDDSTGKAA